MEPENTTIASDGRPLTFGEKAVGLTFNPGGDPQVTAIKAAYAAIIDQLNDMREIVKKQIETLAPDHRGPFSEKVRHFSVAITDAETAQMRAVKAITWQDQ